MAWSLSKKEMKELHAHQEGISVAEAKVEEAIKAHTEALRVANLALAQAVDDYNAKQQDAYQFFDEIAAERRDNWSEKSEKWQESDRGQSVDYYIQEIETVRDALGNDLQPDYPDPVSSLEDMVNETVSELIENMPREPEEW